MLSQLIPKAYAACDPTQAGINLGDCALLSDGTKVSDVYDTPAVMIDLIVRNLFLVAGIILFIMIFVAGFKFLNGETKGKDEAQSIMTTAIVGFLIMFSAYWIIQIVKVVTGAAIPI